MASAPRALCGSGVFGRVMFSRVSGSTWSPEAAYEADGDRHIGLRVEEMQIPLASPLVEAEVVRRRLPALLTNAQGESRVYQPLVERMRAHEYVVAPIVAESAVIGLLHADRTADGRPLTTMHRDLLRMFADGVGLSYEKSLLAERLERQHQYVLDVCKAMGSVTDIQRTNRIAPRSAAPEPAKLRSPQPAESRNSSRLGALTGREREVLGLLASGATNAQLADQLTVAESTVKSHVKHILHKLGAGNRAAAISYYLRETRSANRSDR